MFFSELKNDIIVTTSRILNSVTQRVNIKEEDVPRSRNYLGVKLDRTLTFNQHLEEAKNKLKTRNNIVRKVGRKKLEVLGKCTARFCLNISV